MIKKLLCFLGGALLVLNVQGQKIEPFYIGDRIPDLPLNRIINCKDTVTTLSSFGDKLLIFDFWGVHCSSCIRMFPLEDSLQRLLKNSVQFVLATLDSTGKVGHFLDRWNSGRSKPLSLPIVTSAVLLYKLFRLKYIPHYVWLMPNGTFIAQTAEDFVGEAAIRQVLKAIAVKEQELKEDGFGEEMFRFPPLTVKQKQQFAPFLQPNISL